MRGLVLAAAMLLVSSCQSQKLYEISEGLETMGIAVRGLADDLEAIEDSGDGRFGEIGTKVDGLLATIGGTQKVAKEAADSAAANEAALTALPGSPITGNPLVDLLITGALAAVTGMGATNIQRDSKRRKGTDIRPNPPPPPPPAPALTGAG